MNDVVGGTVEVGQQPLDTKDRRAGYAAGVRAVPVEFEAPDTLGQELTLTAYGRGDVYHTDERRETLVPIYRGTEGWHSRGIGALAATCNGRSSGRSGRHPTGRAASTAGTDANVQISTFQTKMPAR